MAFSFELKLAISSELYGAISAGPEQSYVKSIPANLFIAYRINKFRFHIPRHRERQPPVGFNRRLCEFLLHRYAAGRKHVGKQRRTLDEILHQRHFIEEHIAEALRFQCLEVAVHICQRISCGDLDERSLT